MAKQEHPPAAVCTDCHHYSYSIELVGWPCGQKQRDGSSRCKASMSSAFNDSDWKPCSECVDGCEACQRTGWQYVRR